MIAGGGTAGHLTPAIAVAAALQREEPSGDVLLVGRRGGMEERIVPAAGLPLTTIRVRGVDTSRPLLSAAALARLPFNVLEARRLLRRFKPDVVVGAAGYVCVPVALAASTLRIPLVMLEQNLVPGRATQRLARRARAVAASYAETAPYLPGVRVVHTGNPVRAAVLDALPAPLGARPRRLLVTGGSQGARRINLAVLAAAPLLLDRNPELRITHACGERDAAVVLAEHAALPATIRERYVVAPFFDDIAAQIAAADIVLMRCGGSSLAEVSVLGRPMLLVPYPHAGAHQVENARPYVEAGAARLILDAELEPPRVAAEVQALLDDPAAWRAMAGCSRESGRPDAAERVLALLHEVAA